MSDVATRQAIPGGDSGVWDTFEQPQNHLSVGALSRYLYLDGVTVKLTAGYVGLYNGSQYYNISNSAARSLSLVGLTVSLWAKVELSVVAGVVTTTITSIVGASNPASLPASFTGAYDGTKGGYYETATKRIIGLLWINAAGACEGIVNCMEYDGYSGYATSDDTSDVITPFIHLASRTHSAYTPEVTVSKSVDYVIPNLASDLNVLATAGTNGITLTLPAPASNSGRKIKVLKLDSTNSAVTLKPNAAETISGMLYVFMIDQYQNVTLYCDGTSWFIVSGYLAADSGPVSTNDESNRHFGTMTITYNTLVSTFQIGEIIKEGTSSNTGIVVADTGVVLTLWKCYSPGGTHGVFTNGRTITGQLSGATANVTNGGTTKNQDCNLYHGFGVELGLLEYKSLYSVDNTAWEELIHADDVSVGDVGVCVHTVDTNNVLVHTGANGIIQMTNAGVTNVLTAGDDYYRVRAIWRF